ncbi:putative carboxymethylenebutenolidase [Teratosphaeria destructans]|uniref:Carboxymethylenebutenolidase n=1 Tax=Teratosphaeria destructans TaxID=418781 RepID=A0A9W7SY44_9PEZI|nr:putative carboxymethylenebutenolidase [Teratosphaeria destructans]
MLITESHLDVPTQAGGDMRIFLFHPTIPNYPQAKFPGVVLFSEIYQDRQPRLHRRSSLLLPRMYVLPHLPIPPKHSPTHTQRPQSTPPPPSPTTPPAQQPATPTKLQKHLSAYDEDATLTIDTLARDPRCNARIGATGMCLGGHLAFRAALDPRVRAARDDSLARAAEIKGELAMIFGKKDTHVPPAGRDLIRQTLHDAGVTFSFWEVAWAQHAFIRDELSKGRYDPAIAGICFQMLLELFGRTLNGDLGPASSEVGDVEHVC